MIVFVHLIIIISLKKSESVNKTLCICNLKKAFIMFLHILMHLLQLSEVKQKKPFGVKSSLSLLNLTASTKGCVPSRDYISVTLTLIWRKHTCLCYIPAFKLFLQGNLKIHKIEE